MPAHTIHAEVRALERYGVEPSAADWSAAVDAIIGVVAGESRAALLLRRLHSNSEEWIVRVSGVAMRVVYKPSAACIITALPRTPPLNRHR